MNIKYSTPLIVPKGIVPTKKKIISRSKWTWLQTMSEFQKEVKRIGLENVVIHSNYSLNNGLLKAELIHGHNKGILVEYSFGQHKNKRMYCDQFYKGSDNLKSILMVLRKYREIKDLKVQLISG